MGNILYNYNDNDFLTAHCRESFNLLIFKVLFCIPLLSQIYRKNVLKGLSDPTLTKPNGCFSEPLRTCRCCWTCWSSFSPWVGDFPCLLRALSSCSCLLNVQIPWEGGPLYRISWGTHQPIPAPATSTLERIPRATSQVCSLSEPQFCIWDGFMEKVRFELDLKAGWIQRSGAGKGALCGKMTFDRGQRCRTRNVRMTGKVSRIFLFFL